MGVPGPTLVRISLSSFDSMATFLALSLSLVTVSRRGRASQPTARTKTRPELVLRRRASTRSRCRSRRCLSHLAVGYVLAGIIGVGLGALLWGLRYVHEATSPYLYFLYVLPAPVLSRSPGVVTEIVDITLPRPRGALNSTASAAAISRRRSATASATLSPSWSGLNAGKPANPAYETAAEDSRTIPSGRI
jgi:hypothetical protein